MTLHGVSKRPLLLLSFIVLVVQLIAGRYGLCAAANSDADGHSHKQLTNELVPYLKTLRHAMVYFQSQVGRVTLDAVFCLRIALGIKLASCVIIIFKTFYSPLSEFAG